MSREAPAESQHIPWRHAGPGGERVGQAVGPRHLVTLSRPSDGSRITAVVRGEVDWDSRDAFRRTLVSALKAAPRGLDLRLEGVSFWDCTALNVVLDVHRLAGAEGKVLTVRTMSPVVRRVLELTGSLGLLTEGGAP